jgi:hypothetical protein
MTVDTKAATAVDEDAGAFQALRRVAGCYRA